MALSKPRRRGGYRSEETEQVVAACLTVAVTLGAFMDSLCIVGGLVPGLIIDRRVAVSLKEDEQHAGTNDLDVALAIGLLDENQYSEIANRLRQEGFRPDVNENGNPTPQRWKLPGLKVTIDFLLPPLSENDRGGRVQPLEGDFGAVIAPGLEMAFDEKLEVELDGHTLRGEAATRTIPVCGPGAFVVLKSFALHERGEPKDAYDLVYVLRRWPGGAEDIAGRLADQRGVHGALIQRALNSLASDFRSPDSIGPQRVADFDEVRGEDRDAATADAHGYVDDFLRACGRRDLR